MAKTPSPLGTIRLDGKPYRVDIPSYRIKDITDFSPRAQVAGGSIVHSELGLYQPYMKTDWRHGLGFIWETDEMGYLKSVGNVDTRHGGLAMMMTIKVSSDTADKAKEGFTVFDAEPYSWGAGGGGISGIRRYTGAPAWADQAKAATGDYDNVNFALATDAYLFVCPDGGRIEKINTSNVASVAGVNASSTDYKWLVVHSGFIYAGKDDSAIVFRSSEEDLSDLAGDVGDDPDYMIVGGGRYPTLAALSWLGKLLVATWDGLYEIGEDLKARKKLDFSGQASATNFRMLGTFNGKVIFSIRDSLFTWNGATVNDISPKELTDTFPYITYGLFNNFVVTDRFMYCTGRTNDSTYEEHLLCFDGIGWHKLMDLSANGSDVVTAMGYDVANNYLWIHIDDAGNTTYYVEFQDQSEFPKANFPTSGTHEVISSRMAMGFERVIKSAPSIIIEADNVTLARYLIVYYQRDSDGTWYEWGGTGKGRITSNGVSELFNPTGLVGSTLEFNWMQIKVGFVTDASAQSPVLEGMTVRFIMRPKTLWGHSFMIPVGTFQKNATRRSLKIADEIIKDLMKAKASYAPVLFEDIFASDPKPVYVATAEIRVVERHPGPDRGGVPDFESVVNVNIVELG